MNSIGSNMTFIFQLVNTMLLLAIVLGIPYFIVRLVYKTRKMEKRLTDLERIVEALNQEK